MKLQILVGMNLDLIFSMLDPVKNRKQLASCFLLSVSKVGDEIIADVERRYDMGEYRTDLEFQLLMEDPYELFCEYAVFWDYDHDPKYASRSCWAVRLKLRAFVTDEEQVEPQIRIDLLEQYVLNKLDQDDH